MDEIAEQLGRAADVGARAARVDAPAAMTERALRHRERAGRRRSAAALVVILLVLGGTSVLLASLPEPGAQLADSPPREADPPVATTAEPTAPAVAAPVPPASPPASPGVAQVRVEFRNQERRPGDNHVRPQFRVLNTGSEALDLDGLTLRYWYTAEAGTPEEVNCDWAAVNCLNLEADTAAADEGQRYLEVGFEDAGLLAPGETTGEIQLRVHHTDWSDYDERDDWSWDEGRTTWGSAPHVTAYRDGTRVWGEPPPGLE